MKKIKRNDLVYLDKIKWKVISIFRDYVFLTTLDKNKQTMMPIEEFKTKLAKNYSD